MGLEYVVSGDTRFFVIDAMPGAHLHVPGYMMAQGQPCTSISADGMSYDMLSAYGYLQENGILEYDPSTGGFMRPDRLPVLAVYSVDVKLGPTEKVRDMDNGVASLRRVVESVYVSELTGICATSYRDVAHETKEWILKNDPEIRTQVKCTSDQCAAGAMKQMDAIYRNSSRTLQHSGYVVVAAGEDYIPVGVHEDDSICLGRLVDQIIPLLAERRRERVYEAAIF